MELESVPSTVNETWNLLFSDNGIKLWLKGADKEFSTFKDFSLIRTKWKLNSWANEATLQMWVFSNKDSITIAFYIDKLPDEDQRKETKTYRTKTLDEITKN